MDIFKLRKELQRLKDSHARHLAQEEHARNQVEEKMARLRELGVNSVEEAEQEIAQLRQKRDDLAAKADKYIRQAGEILERIEQ